MSICCGSAAHVARRVSAIGGIIAIATVFAVATPSAAQQRGSKRQSSAPVMKSTVVVFPPETKGGITVQLTDSLTDVVESRLSVSGGYQAQYFLTSLPMVRRALLEQTLSNADVSPPYDSDTKVKRLISLIGQSRAITSSIDDVEYDAAKQQMTVVLSMRYVDFSGDKPVIRSYGDSITGAEKGARSEKDVQAASDLTRTLAERLMADFLKAGKASQTTPPAKKQ